MTPITHFKYEYDFLSNFHPSVVTIGNIITKVDGEIVKLFPEGDEATYATVEHAYQAAKYADPERRRIFTFEFNPNLTAGQAKRLGQLDGRRENWKDISIPVMRQLLIKKFDHKVLGEKLLATGDTHLEEGNNWHDVFWGVCYHKLEGRTCKQPAHEAFGDNYLGKLLMEVRGFYKGFTDAAKADGFVL